MLLDTNQIMGKASAVALFIVATLLIAACIGVASFLLLLIEILGWMLS